MKICILALLLLAIAGQTFAHKGIIKGNLYSKKDNIPLVGASVMLVNTGKTTQTDKFGAYIFTDLDEGQYEIRFSYLGFESATATVQVNENEAEVVPLIVNLTEGDISLREVSISANKLSPAQTVSSLDISLRPTQTSQDILRIVPGLFIAQHAGGGKAEQIFLRGFDIDHGTDISLTVDGMPVNMVSHAHGQGYSDLHFVIPETVEKVDFGKGPYQASKGNFATAGYADFITKAKLDKSTVKLEAGRFNTFRALGMFNLLGEGAAQKQQHAYLATEYLFSNGYFESPQNLKRLNILGKYQGMLAGNKIFSASVSTFRSSWNASGQIPERAVRAGIITRFGAIDDTEGGTTSRHNINLSLTNLLSNNSLLENQVYISHYDFELYSNFTFFLDDPVNGDQIRQKESRTIYGYKGSFSNDTYLWGRALKSEAGVNIRYDVVDDSELSRTSDRTFTRSVVKQGDINELNAAVYLSGTLEVLPKLSLNAALRFDQFLFNYKSHFTEDATEPEMQNIENRVSPKLNLYYTPSSSLQLYASAGMGLHSNDTRVSVLATGGNVLPAAYGTDLGVIVKPHEKILLNAAIWLLDLEQELVYVGDEGIVEPSGKTRRFGMDVSMRYQVAKNLFADADLNLVKPRAKEKAEGENFIPLAPLATSTGGITYNRNKGVFGSFRYRYLKDRPANEDYSLTAEGYTLLDAIVGYIYKRFEFKLTAENLLNSEWKEAQFDTETRLRPETEPVSEIHFTPGTPFFIKAGIAYSFR